MYWRKSREYGGWCIKSNPKPKLKLFCIKTYLLYKRIPIVAMSNALSFIQTKLFLPPGKSFEQLENQGQPTRFDTIFVINKNVSGQCDLGANN